MDFKVGPLDKENSQLLKRSSLVQNKTMPQKCQALSSIDSPLCSSRIAQLTIVIYFLAVAQLMLGNEIVPSIVSQHHRAWLHTKSSVNESLLLDNKQNLPTQFLTSIILVKGKKEW
jgi:hypothetical protein